MKSNLHLGINEVGGIGFAHDSLEFLSSGGIVGCLARGGGY